MYLYGTLPIGSVVLLEESEKRVMILGYAQTSATTGTLYDYCGVPFPEGYLSADELLLFNFNQIEKVYSLGYQDEEQEQFKETIDAAILELRTGSQPEEQQ